MILNAEDFKEYLNEKNIEISERTAVLVKKKFSDESKSSILITLETI
jgi:hypothetical protein